MDQKKSQVLRLVTVNSDETRVERPTRTVPLVHPDTGRPFTGVEATVAMLGDGEYEALEKKHRNIPEKSARGVEWKLDARALTLEILVRCVQSWSGIVAADGKVIAPTAAALQALDELNKLHLAGVARTPAEIVDAEVVAASFREPAAVAGMAG